MYLRAKHIIGHGVAGVRLPKRRRRLTVALVAWGLALTPVAPGQNQDAPLDWVKGLARQIVAANDDGARDGAQESLAGQNPDASKDEPAQTPTTNAAIEINDVGLVDLHVRDTPIPTILEMLAYEYKVNIVATDSVVDNVSANLFSVTVDEALEAILRPRGYVFHRAGKVIYVGTPQDITTLLPPPRTRVFHLKYLNRTEAARDITPLLSSVGKIVGGEVKAPGRGQGGGGGRMVTDVEASASTNYLIVTDYAENLGEIERLLKEIDVPPLQVLIEATILRATLNENNQFGIDFTLLGGVDFQNVGSLSNASNDLATGALPADKFQHTTFNVNTQIVGQLPGGFSFGIIKDSVATFVRALEDVTDVTVVANPKLVALNRQSAEVIVGRRDGYLTTTVTETAAIQSVDFLETGTQIRFRPIINPDGTVRLEVHPKDSNGGLTADNLPFEETTEAHGQIVVRDGHTVLIGGLFRERTVGSASQVPVLGDIPIAGRLFKSTRDQTIREEVVILLTVHILKNNDRESRWAEGLVDDVERIRAGSRKGLFGFGRERLAQAFYQEALDQLDRGNTERALFNIRMALQNNPRHLAALKLEEQLLGRHLWDSDGTRSRTLVLDLLRQHEGDQPDLGRPPSEWRMLDKDSPTDENADRPRSPSRPRRAEPAASKRPVKIEDIP